MNAQTGIVNIRGKEYQTVALRVQMFREKHPDHSLSTAVICRDDDCVVMQATIGDPAGRVIATGHAEEYRKSSQINKTSALENAETSAIGRALAAFGIGGTEFASANEVVNAIHQQGTGAVRGQREESKVNPAASDLQQQLEQSVEEASFPEGPAKNITTLKKLQAALWREIEGCGDDDELTPLLHIEDNRALMRQLSKLEGRHAELWIGDGEDNPGLKGLIENKRAEFAQAQPNILQAG